MLTEPKNLVMQSHEFAGEDEDFSSKRDSPRLFSVVDSNEPADWVTEFGDDGERYSYLRALNKPGSVPEFADESIRELLVKPYRFVYKLTDEHVFIVAFIHGAQRFLRL
jgi:hypothetical protein